LQKNNGEIIQHYKGGILDKYMDKIDKMDEKHKHYIKDINKIYGDGEDLKFK